MTGDPIAIIRELEKRSDRLAEELMKLRDRVELLEKQVDQLLSGRPTPKD